VTFITISETIKKRFKNRLLVCFSLDILLFKNKKNKIKIKIRNLKQNVNKFLHDGLK